jgi:nitronate monooxygenase
MTDEPFGVNLTFLPSFSSPPYPAYIHAIVEGGVRIVETYRPQSSAIHTGLEGARGQGPQMHLGASLMTAERIGCDAISVDGSVRHPGQDDIPLMILLPRVAEELKIPFVASGGMADGRSLVAALARCARQHRMRHETSPEAPRRQRQAGAGCGEWLERLISGLHNKEQVLTMRR